MRHGISTERPFDSSIAVETTTTRLSLRTPSLRTPSLRTLFPTARFVTADDIEFKSVAETSETCQQGDLVVYRIGKDDPTKLVADAMARGAIGILTEQLLPCPLPQCIVGDIEIALAKITSDELERPDRKLLTIGVTGSAGKTTTSLLVASLLRSSGYRAAYQTDLGDCDGIVQQTSKDAIPSNSSLVRWIAEAADAGTQAAVIELSDDNARHGGYDSIEFDVLIVAGNSNANTDFGPTAVQCAVNRLISDGIVILPAEDQKSLQLVRDANARPLTYSTRRSADIAAKIIDQAGGMTTLMVTHQNTTAMMETPLCGAANAANHLAAGLVGLLLGHRLEEIVENLGKLRDLPGRDQRLVEFGQPTVVIDAGGTPQRAAAALRTQRSMKAGGRLWCILAVDGTDPSVILSQYGSVLERFADHPIVTSTSDSKRAFTSASHCVLDGVEKCASMRLVADRHRSIEWAMSQASSNDTILILTNQRNLTAHQQRRDVETVKGWVAAARVSDTESDQVELKVFK